MTLLDHYKNGTIKELFDKGVISINVYTYFRYYDVYLAYRNKGNSKNKAYLYAADECGCSDRTIRTAITLLTKD